MDQRASEFELLGPWLGILRKNAATDILGFRCRFNSLDGVKKYQYSGLNPKP